MAKFKVGDKVKVREDLVVGNCYGKERFTDWMKKYKGKEIEIEGILKNTYISVGLHWTDEMLEEVKEDKMEKTFKEVIADIKEGEVWESHCKRIICNQFGDLKIENISKEGFGPYILVNPNNTFKLKRKEYTFEEAFKAYEEGKEIESCKYRYKKINDEILYINLEKGYKDTLKEVQMFFTLEEIKGKWYIND